MTTERENTARRQSDLRIMACAFCRNPDFLRWMREIGHREPSEKTAKAFILTTCGIHSRSELDEDAEAAALFHDCIRRPFIEWRDGVVRR